MKKKILLAAAVLCVFGVIAALLWPRNIRISGTVTEGEKTEKASVVLTFPNASALLGYPALSGHITLYAEGGVPLRDCSLSSVPVQRLSDKALYASMMCYSERENKMIPWELYFDAPLENIVLRISAEELTFCSASDLFLEQAGIGSEKGR